MKSVIYAVTIEVDPAAEKAWDDWNTRHHIPDVLKEPGFLRATKYRLRPSGEGWPAYVVHYELENEAAVDAYLAGEAVVRLRNDHLSRFANVTRLSRTILLPTAALERGS
jgi:quinol monooxygenase YgiN